MKDPGKKHNLLVVGWPHEYHYDSTGMLDPKNSQPPQFEPKGLSGYETNTPEKTPLWGLNTCACD